MISKYFQMDLYRYIISEKFPVFMDELRKTLL